MTVVVGALSVAFAIEMGRVGHVLMAVVLLLLSMLLMMVDVDTRA